MSKMTRTQVAQIFKNRFFKSCRSRRELSNALIESFWEAILVEIRPFPFRKYVKGTLKVR